MRSDEINIAMEFGKVIKELRYEIHMKQKDLAFAIGVTATYLSQVEHSIQNPSIDLIARIANHFNISVTDMILRALNIHKGKIFLDKIQPIIESVISYLLTDEHVYKQKPIYV